ncbi:baseplate J/gp47 family protein [Candidatus Bathyarchaeota archaeon]|nr:baseplate J/gp47 family protein [Candidatus Bathyarchaeota archaeon]
MAFVKKSYNEIRDAILAQITRGIVNEEHIHEIYRTRYKLDNTPVKSIVKVEGIMNGARHTFREGVDYKLSGDMLEWLPNGNKPDDKTPFYVNYIFGAPSGITDINPGSVTRTIVEAISREIEFLYEQLNKVYLAGFIDTASGSALDLVVSLLGISRKPPEHATGKVTFGRSTDPAEVQVNREAHFYDGKAIYELNSLPIKSIIKVEGPVSGSSYIFQRDIDYIVVNRGIEWLVEGKKPDYNTIFYVDYIAYEQIKIPAGSRVSTYSPTPQEAKVFVTTEERVLEKISEGVWEADVPVRALTPGTAGNVYAGMITVMPQPLMGVEYVINRGDILSGTEAESDEDLRARAKHALEVAGKATLTSLEAGVRGVEGVTCVLIEDMPDGVPGIVKIVVDGGDEDEIKKVIEDIRAAGVRVEFLRPKPVYLDLSLTVVLGREVEPSEVEREIEGKVRGYISSLKIGEDVIYSRIIGAALSVNGVYDVGEVIIKAYRRDGEMVTSTKANIEISSEERATARTINVLVKTSGGKA